MNWTAVLMCLFVIYTTGFNLVGLFAIFDGLYKFFTKYHIVAILASLTTLFFGTISLFWFIACVCVLFTMTKYKTIVDFYELVKQTVNIGTMVVPHTDNESKRLKSINDKMEYVNIKYLAIEKWYNNTIKTNVVNRVNLCIYSSYWKYVEQSVNISNYAIECISQSICANVMMLYNALKDLPPVTNAITKCDSLYASGKFLIELTNDGAKQHIPNNVGKIDTDETFEDFTKMLTEMSQLNTTKTSAFDNKMFDEFQKLLGGDINMLADKKISLRQKQKKHRKKIR